MKVLTLKEYAVKHKISIFSAMKLAKYGKVPSETRTINNKEELVILTDEAPSSTPVEHPQEIDYKKAYLELKTKYDTLLRQSNKPL